MALRVTQTLVASSDPLSAAQTLALNFPSFANAFRSMPVNHSLLEDVRQNARVRVLFSFLCFYGSTCFIP
jgi:hypothetical protein